MYCSWPFVLRLNLSFLFSNHKSISYERAAPLEKICCLFMIYPTIGTLWILLLHTSLQSLKVANLYTNRFWWLYRGLNKKIQTTHISWLKMVLPHENIFPVLQPNLGFQVDQEDVLSQWKCIGMEVQAKRTTLLGGEPSVERRRKNCWIIEHTSSWARLEHHWKNCGCPMI